MLKNIPTIIFVVALVLILGALTYILVTKEEKKESYRGGALYINEEKLKQDIYPRANGTIYGRCPSLFNGYPYYDTVNA